MRLLHLTTFISSIFISSSGFALQSATEISQHAHDLHFKSIVMDTHIDTTQRLIWEHIDLGRRDKEGSIDIPRMRQGGLNAVFFSIWIPGTITGQEAVRQANTQINAIKDQIRLRYNDFKFCTTAAEVRDVHDQRKTAVLMGMEGGHMINNNLDILREYAKAGVRYMTLTHSVNTDWADSSTDKPVHNGLTEFGKQVVQEMNKLGMMIDISHVSDKTFYDALTISKAPMIASHSSVRSICNAPRNMTDDMIKALAAKGGVIQINYNDGFISQEYLDAINKSDELKILFDQLEKRCGDNQSCIILGAQAITRKMAEQGKLPKVNWDKIVEHIDYVVKLVGVDHVGLGSDFDGADMPFGMEDATHLPQITEALLAKGYSDSDVQKILGGNTLRVMQGVEEVAKKLQST